MGIFKNIKTHIEEKQKAKLAEQEKSDRQIRTEKFGQESYSAFYQKTTATSSKLGQMTVETLDYSDEKGFNGIETRTTVYTQYGPITKRVVECSKVSDKGFNHVGDFVAYEGYLPPQDSKNPGYYNLKTTETSLSNPVERITTFCKDYDGVYMNPEGEFFISSGRRVTNSENK